MRKYGMWRNSLWEKLTKNIRPTNILQTDWRFMCIMYPWCYATGKLGEFSLGSFVNYISIFWPTKYNP